MIFFKKESKTNPSNQTGFTVYGVSKKQKDAVVVKGRKYFFNHIGVIEEI